MARVRTPRLSLQFRARVWWELEQARQGVVDILEQAGEPVPPCLLAPGALPLAEPRLKERPPRTPGRCRGCGVPHDATTPGCNNCRMRHLMRAKASAACADSRPAGTGAPADGSREQPVGPAPAADPARGWRHGGA